MEKRLTKKQWLNLFEKNEFIEYLDDELFEFKDDEIILAQEMRDIINNLDVEERQGNVLDTSYYIQEIVSFYEDFEKNKEFLLKVTKLFD